MAGQDTEAAITPGLDPFLCDSVTVSFPRLWAGMAWYRQAEHKGKLFLPSIHPLSIHSSTHHLPIHSSIHLPIYLSIHPVINPSIYPFINPSIHSLIYPSTHPFIYPPHPIHPFIHSYIHTFTHLSIHPFIHLSQATSINGSLLCQALGEPR